MKMSSFSKINQIFLILLLLIHSSITLSIEESDLETYIVHVDPSESYSTFSSSSSSSSELERWYHSFLATFNASPRMVYTYKKAIKGFAARLTPDEVEIIRKHDGFLHARPERKLPLHTTHTPDFLGLHRDFGLWKDSNYGEGVIIGVLDTGIFPHHPSFSDEGMPPPPARWKGKCEFQFNSSTAAACNNKLIGARYFVFGQGSPNDDNGHGTHTAGTAAGNFVAGASSFRQGSGTAVGIAPRAHLAVYKVCFDTGHCSESDVLAAMDAAIEDGVDVLSVSLGWVPTPFTFDAVALGAYSAIKHGIFVSCSAMNSGPSHGTLSNEAPWILTVGASTVDRKLTGIAVLGNKEEIDGEAIIQQRNFSITPLPLVYAGFCISGTLKGIDARGKIIACDRTKESISTIIGEAIEAEAEAVILINEESEGATKLLVYITFPTTQVSYGDGLRIKAYINSTSQPTATLSFKGTVIGDDRAPVVASFSSRGPSVESPGILKPDILGPGVNILAAWPVSLEGNNNRFVFASGTSMACPHLSGVAALLKSAHPDWSPAAIKSAIMTTADVVNLARGPIEDETMMRADAFATGAGHVNPSRASDPGLVYDVEARDYIPYLCGLLYTDREIGIITQEKVNCSEVSSISESQLNYPSFSILFGSDVQTYTRTVTNVGEANSSYVVKVSAPDGVGVAVKPDRLDFTQLKEKLTYQVTFSLHRNGDSFNYSQGFLTWSSTRYDVRSPIVAIMQDWEYGT